MRVLNEYPGSHHYWDEYEKTDWFCAHCGKKEVWESTCPGDYYVGSDSFCTACGWACNYLGGPKKIELANKLRQLAQLISGVTAAPTTPRGS